MAISIINITKIQHNDLNNQTIAEILTRQKGPVLPSTFSGSDIFIPIKSSQNICRIDLVHNILYDALFNTKTPNFTYFFHST